MKPTNDIPTGTDLLIEKIDDLIEVIKHLTSTINKERHDISEYHRPLTTGFDPSQVDTEGAEIYRDRTARRADPEPGDPPMPIPEAPCDYADRTEANQDSSADRGTWYSDIAYSDILYSSGTNSTVISRGPHEYSISGISGAEPVADLRVGETGSYCRSTEVSSARG